EEPQRGHQSHGGPQDAEQDPPYFLTVQGRGNVLIERHAIEDHQRRVDGRHFPANRLDSTSYRSRRADVECQSILGPVLLPDWNEEERLRTLGELVILAVLDQTDDGEPFAPAAHLPANRVPASEKTARELLVDDHHFHARIVLQGNSGIAQAKVPSGQERYLQQS